MPGSIHSQSAQEFYKEIGASQRALSILRDGFKLPFIDENVPTFWYRNNFSLLKHYKFAEKKLNEWIKEGYVEETLSRPKHISPLSVATRTLVTDEVKLRLCLDATVINDLLVTESVKLPTLEYSESLIQKNDHFTTLDLQNCYFHVSLHPSDHDKIAFAFPLSEDRNETRYRFFKIKNLIYGLKPATLVIHLLTKPLIDHLYRLEVKATIFIDDVRCNNNSDDSVSKDTTTVKSIFSKAGWIFNDSKESPPSQEVYYLGFYYNSITQRYKVHESKIKQIEKRIDELEEKAPLAKPQDIAKIVGKIIACELATSYIPRLCCYRYFTWVAKVVTEKAKWYQEAKFPKKLIADLRRALSYIKELSGNIRHKKHVYKELSPQSPKKNSSEYAGDGNELYGAYFNIQDPFKYSIIQYGEYNSKELSSSFRELLVLYHCVKDNVKENKGNDLVYFTDSKVLFFWHRYGTSTADVANLLTKIKYACIKNDVILEISWKPREDSRIQLADTSCRTSTDEFMIDNKKYKQICQRFSFAPEVDLFASTLLHKTDTFYSESPTLGSSGANALNFPWNRKSYCHPPKKLMYAVTQKIEAEKHVNMILIFLRTKHNTDLERFLDKDGCFKSYIKGVVAFDSRVHFPGDNPTSFMRSNHSWYAMRIIKNNDFCKLYKSEIFYLE